MAHLLRIGEQTPSLSETLSEAVKRVEYGEDFIGILGRVGRSQPVALFLTEAHLYSRSCLLGLPLFLEPDTERDALLVLSSRDGAVTGPLQETLDEAERRGVLTILDVPALTSEEVRKVVQGTPGLKIDEGQLLEAEEQHLSVDSVRTLFLKHLADQADESVHQSSEELKAEFIRLTEPVRSLLALAALEGIEFHLAAVASVLDMDPETAEDILLDEEFELNGECLGGARGLVDVGTLSWIPAKEGVTPRLSFSCMVARDAALASLEHEERVRLASSLEAALWKRLMSAPWRTWPRPYGGCHNGLEIKPRSACLPWAVRAWPGGSGL